MKSTFDSFIEILFLFAEMLKEMGKFFLVDSWGNTPLGTAVAVVSWLLVLSVACGILWGIFSWLNTARTKLREWDCTVIKKTVTAAYTTTDWLPGYGVSLQVTPVFTFTPVKREVPKQFHLCLDMAGHKGWLEVAERTFWVVDEGDNLTLTYRVGRLNGEIYMLGVR